MRESMIRTVTSPSMDMWQGRNAARVQHCAGGPGADSYGEVGDLNSGDPRHSLDGALEQWVEKGTVPGAIIASKFSGEDRQHATMMRPLCPYPQSAKYKGDGDTN